MSSPTRRPSKNTLVVTADDGHEIIIRISFVEKVKRMLFSKQEWDAYLLEKIENAKKSYEESKTDTAGGR